MNDHLENDPDIWGNDPLTEYLSSLIEKMPDRPKITFAILVQDKSKDEEIIKAMAEFKDSYISFRSYKVIGHSFGVCLLGFYPTTETNFCRFMEVVSTLPFSEGAIYLDGKVRLRIAPTKPPIRERSQV